MTKQKSMQNRQSFSALRRPFDPFSCTFFANRTDDSQKFDRYFDQIAAVGPALCVTVEGFLNYDVTTQNTILDVCIAGDNQNFVFDCVASGVPPARTHSCVFCACAHEIFTRACIHRHFFQVKHRKPPVSTVSCIEMCSLKFDIFSFFQ